MTKYQKFSIKNSLHISFVIKGGKAVFGICNLNGRNLSIIKNNSHLLISNSTHAECNAISNIFGFDNSKFKNKRSKFTIYSIAFKYSLNDNIIYVKDACPCKSCTNIIYQSGINNVFWSNDNGKLVNSHISYLQRISSFSFGDRFIFIKNNINMIKNINTDNIFNLYVNNIDTFNYIYNLKKTIEGRLWKGVIRKLKRSQIIKICFQNKNILCKISFIRRYNNFKTLLTKNNISKVLPGINNIIEGVNTYNNIYKNIDLSKYDTVAIGLSAIITNYNVKF